MLAEWVLPTPIWRHQEIMQPHLYIHVHSSKRTRKKHETDANRERQGTYSFATSPTKVPPLTSHLSLLVLLLTCTCAYIIGASVSEPHLGSSTRPLSVCQSVSLSVCQSVYIYIYIYHASVIFGPADPALRANVSRLI